jgi:hypothetical protein
MAWGDTVTPTWSPTSFYCLLAQYKHQLSVTEKAKKYCNDLCKNPEETRNPPRAFDNRFQGGLPEGWSGKPHRFDRLPVSGTNKFDAVNNLMCFQNWIKKLENIKKILKIFNLMVSKSFSFLVELLMPSKYTKRMNIWKKLTPLGSWQLDLFLDLFGLLKKFKFKISNGACYQPAGTATVPTR